ncbi:hypothetical protein ACWCW7_33715 [Nocardia tengchongensis]
MRTGPATAGVIAPRALAMSAAALMDPANPAPMLSVGRTISVFVTEGLPEDSDARRLSNALFRCAVVPILAPSPLVLPAPGNRRRCWLSVPYGPARPRLEVVAEAFQRATRW